MAMSNADKMKKYGFVLVRDFFTEDEVKLLHKISEELPNIEGLIRVEEAGKDQLCRVEDMLSFSPDLKELVEKRILPFISEVGGKPYVPFKDKLNFKWPGGGAFAPHQDFPAYTYFSPSYHITMMLTIDPANLQNGCLFASEDYRRDLNIEDGKLDILPYIKGGKRHGHIDEATCEKIKWIPVETNPRDILLFDSFIPHKSEPNNSDKPRRAMFITCNPKDEGDCFKEYYRLKREDPQNPAFHFATPTVHQSQANKEEMSKERIPV